MVAGDAAFSGSGCCPVGAHASQVSFRVGKMAAPMFWFQDQCSKVNEKLTSRVAISSNFLGQIWV